LLIRDTSDMRNIVLIICLLACAQFGVAQDSTLICHQDQIEMVPLEQLNTKSFEFAPVYYNTGIVFVEAREKNRFIDPKSGQAYLDLMFAEIGPNNTTGKAVSFSPNIRTQFHEGPCTFSADGSELFFTRSSLSGGTGIEGKDGEVQLKIYHATKGAEDWENIVELPFCSDQYSVAHPTLSEDGNYLVFTSDMPGGQGGRDLWMVNRLNGEWSIPINLGPQINSKGNERYPFLHSDGYLIFSSDGYSGKGGLDLYVSKWISDHFSGFQHLSAPFNSNSDDLGLIISPDGKSGFMASDRKPTQGKDDLYAWTSPQSIFCSTLAPMELIHELTVRNEEMQGIENAYVWLIPMTQEGPTDHKEYFSTELVPKPGGEGNFYLKWSVGDTLSKATADAITSSIGRASLFSAPKATYVLVVQHDGYVPYVEVFPQDVLPADVVLKKIAAPSTKCFNTQFVVYNEIGDVLLNGAAVTLDGNCIKGIKLYTDDNGKAMYCIPEKCMVKVTIEQEGYAPHAFTFTSEEEELWSVYLKSSEGLTGPAAPIASGTIIVLDNIYYDFNKSEIRKGEAGELIALADQLKKYPDLKIELTSHTDTRGTADYNMELSQRRSESSKSYLLLLGINASRILTKAAGETQPRNKCVDDVPCSEAEHQFNRRTEVKIINPAEGMQIRYKAAG
jgi:outer membrane protein OmpA-like peptidoglycan-associated protein